MVLAGFVPFNVGYLSGCRTLSMLHVTCESFLFQVVGLDTNLQFLVDLMSNSHFKAGEVFTDFISQHSADLFTTRVTSPTTLCQAVVAVLHAHDLQSRNSNLARAGETCSVAEL